MKALPPRVRSEIERSYRQPAGGLGLRQGRRRRKEMEPKTEELEWPWILLALMLSPRQPRSFVNVGQRNCFGSQI